MMLMKKKKGVNADDVPLQKFRPAKRNVHNLLNPDVIDDETRKLLLDGIMRPPLLSPLHEKKQEPLSKLRKQWHTQQDNRSNVKRDECVPETKSEKVLPELKSPSHHLQQDQQQQQQQQNTKKSEIEERESRKLINGEEEEYEEEEQEKLLLHNNGFPCQLRERVHSSSEDLLTAMSTRLCDLEKKQKAYQQELHEMHSKMAELRAKYAEECKERQDAENVIVAIYEEKKELEEQLKEMKQFLADYGLHWRGDKKRDESEESATSMPISPVAPQSTKIIASNNNNIDDNINTNIKSDCDTTDKAKKERQDDHSPYLQEGSQQYKMLSNGSRSPYRKQKGDALERKNEEPSNAEVKCQAHNMQHDTKTHYSAKSIDVKLLERNARILSEYVGVKGVVNDDKSGAICDREVVHVVIYANGIVVNEGAFRPYGWPLCDAFLHDLVDGYYPYEFKDKYPDGFPVEVIDKTKEVHPAGVRRDESQNDVHKATVQSMPSIGRRVDGKKLVEEENEIANEYNSCISAANKYYNSKSNAGKDKCSENLKIVDKCTTSHWAVNNIHQLNDISDDKNDQNGNNNHTAAIGKSKQNELGGNRQREKFIDKLPMQLVTSGGHLVNVRENIASLLTPSDKQTKLINNSDGINTNIERISEFEYMYTTQYERKAKRASTIKATKASTSISSSSNAAQAVMSSSELRCVRVRFGSGETLLMRFQPGNTIAQIRNELFIALPSLKPKIENDKSTIHRAESNVRSDKARNVIANEREENKTESVELCEPYPLRIFSDHSKSLIDLGIKHNCVLSVYTHNEERNSDNELRLGKKL